MGVSGSCVGLEVLLLIAPCCGYLADTVVVRVSHYDVAVAVHGHTGGAVELGGGTLAVSIAPLARARQCVNYTLRRDSADAMVAVVGHDDITATVYRHSPWKVETSSCGPLTILVASLSYACQCRN